MMKCYRRIFALCLSMCMVISLSCVSKTEVYASADLNAECVGSLNENFDGRTDVNALYQKSGAGVLAGRWQFTELSAWGKGSNEIKTPDGGSKVLNMTSTADWAKPGGVDFVFDTPLAPEYILDISYDMHFDSSDTGTVAAALFSNGNFDAHDNAGIGIHMAKGDDSFQIINGDEQGKATVGTWNPCTSGTITVKAVYNLYAWTYNAEIFLDGNLAASMTDGIIGPSSWDKDDTCKPGSTYEKLSFVVQVGTAYVDNISIKAYKPRYNAYARVDYNNPGENTGMEQVAVMNQEVERADRKGMLMDRDREAEMYMLFDVDDSMLYNIIDDTPIEITVEYFDEGNGFFELAYDGYNAPAGRNDIWVNTEYVQMTNSLEWKSYTFYTEHMRMTNRADNADFRLGVFSLKDGRSPGSVVVGSVTLRTLGELEDVASGIVKGETFVKQFSALTAGDNIQVKLHRRLLSENEGGCCILAFYDSAGALVQSVLDTISFAEGNNEWNGCGAAVPQNAASAKVFVWKNNTLAPLMKPILLKN